MAFLSACCLALMMEQLSVTRIVVRKDAAFDLMLGIDDDFHWDHQ